MPVWAPELSLILPLMLALLALVGGTAGPVLVSGKQQIIGALLVLWPVGIALGLTAFGLAGALIHLLLSALMLMAGSLGTSMGLVRAEEGRLVSILALWSGPSLLIPLALGLVGATLVFRLKPWVQDCVAGTAPPFVGRGATVLHRGVRVFEPGVGKAVLVSACLVILSFQSLLPR